MLRLKITSFFFCILFSFFGIFGAEIPGIRSTELLTDAEMRNGFTVLSQTKDGVRAIPAGDVRFPESEALPAWKIAQWDSGPDLWTNRISGDAYSISDGTVKTVRYDPTEHAVSLSLNAANVYGGAPATLAAPWPHLLLEQSFSPTKENAVYYSAGAKHLILSMDVRLSDYTPTRNPEGVNAVQLLTYVYLTGKEDDSFVWFGADLFDDRGPQATSWAMDFGASDAMIYTIGTNETYGGSARSLYRRGEPFVSDRWIRITLDLAPYIADMTQRATKENVFGRTVTPADFQLTGINLGFEIHGNAACTAEVKNLSLKSCSGV